MSHRRLTLEKAALLMLGLGTASVMGIPGFGTIEPPRGPIEGLVREAEGGVLPDAEVVLFDDATLSLLEITYTDEQGRFAFHQEPLRYHIFAHEGPLEPERSTIGGWVLDRRRGVDSGVEIKLRRGVAASVQVTDTNGDPVEGAEVRVLDTSGQAVVVDRLLTDARGEAAFLSPVEAHFAVFPPDGSSARWILYPEIRAEGPAAVHRFAVGLLPPGDTQGTVSDAGGRPLGDIVVSAWDLAGEHWAGWTKTDSAGRFSLATPPESTRLRVVDPAHGHLSASVSVPVNAAAPLSIRLPMGNEIAILADPAAEGNPARIWVWSEETRTWSWGLLTDAEGRVNATASDHIGVVAYPLEGSEPRLEAWGVERGDSVLQLDR